LSIAFKLKYVIIDQSGGKLQLNHCHWDFGTHPNPVICEKAGFDCVSLLSKVQPFWGKKKMADSGVFSSI